MRSLSNAVLHPISQYRRNGSEGKGVNMMLWIRLLSILFLAAALAPSAFAQAPLVRIVADHLAWLYSTEVAATIKCPTGYFPITYAETPQFPFDFDTVYQRDL